jgi:uncharacterized membrane protein HdeD (DUF308 family)
MGFLILGILILGMLIIGVFCILFSVEEESCLSAIIGALLIGGGIILTHYLPDTPQENSAPTQQQSKQVPPSSCPEGRG